MHLTEVMLNEGSQKRTKRAQSDSIYVRFENGLNDSVIAEYRLSLKEREFLGRWKCSRWWMGGRYEVVYICQNLSNCILEISAFCYVWIMSQWRNKTNPKPRPLTLSVRISSAQTPTCRRNYWVNGWWGSVTEGQVATTRTHGSYVAWPTERQLDVQAS